MLALLLAAAGCGFDASATGPASGPPPPAADGAAASTDASLEPVRVRVQALIDGRSRLRLTGATVQWEHLDHAAPGRHEGADQPTFIDGIAWFPVWPDPGENRDCGCLSDAAALLDPPLSAAAGVVEATAIDARGPVTEIEHPSVDNDFTAVVEIDDRARSGSETYEVDIEVVFDR